MAFLGATATDPNVQAIQTELQSATDLVKTIFWILVIVGIIMILWMSFSRA